MNNLPNTTKQPNEPVDWLDIDKRIKVEYELAMASEPTEDGKKAIKRFYWTFLNNYPGLNYYVKKGLDSQKAELIKEIREQVIGEDEPEDRNVLWSYPFKRNQLRAKQRTILAKIERNSEI